MSGSQSNTLADLRMDAALNAGFSDWFENDFWLGDIWHDAVPELGAEPPEAADLDAPPETVVLTAEPEVVEAETGDYITEDPSSSDIAELLAQWAGMGFAQFQGEASVMHSASGIVGFASGATVMPLFPTILDFARQMDDLPEPFDLGVDGFDFDLPDSGVETFVPSDTVLGGDSSEAIIFSASESAADASAANAELALTDMIGNENMTDWLL